MYEAGGFPKNDNRFLKDGWQVPPFLDKPRNDDAMMST